MKMDNSEEYTKRLENIIKQMLQL
jgi:hypothetical protein